MEEKTAKMKECKADLGIVVDPDVDRLALISETGEMFGEEYTLVAVADYVLKHTPGNTVSNLSSSRALKDVTEAYGQQYNAGAVGEVNVVAKMKATRAVIGGEGNGGVIYPESHYGRDALVGVGLFLSHYVAEGKKMTELKKTYPQYFISKNKITLSPEMDVDKILDDLGYTANDLMNVNFVFIVEGKQDKNRLPILLKRYYSEIYDKDGNLSRIAIITTNSCTNIKTYANLKYMNQVYLKDQFLMIRDGDGKDRRKLISQLCNYYEEAGKRDVDHLPKVRPQNVLVLKYYSFENYFFNPKIMAQLGVVESENAFYQTFYEKWQEYLSRLSSGQKLISVIGHDLTGPEDVKAHMEEIRIYMRGHNMFDCFYGRFKKEENELLSRYVALAPREEFADILDAIDRFVYFESRKV